MSRNRGTREQRKARRRVARAARRGTRDALKRTLVDAGHSPERVERMSRAERVKEMQTLVGYRNVEAMVRASTARSTYTDGDITIEAVAA